MSRRMSRRRVSLLAAVLWLSLPWAAQAADTSCTNASHCSVEVSLLGAHKAITVRIPLTGRLVLTVRVPAHFGQSEHIAQLIITPLADGVALLALSPTGGMITLFSGLAARGRAKAWRTLPTLTVSGPDATGAQPLYRDLATNYLRTSPALLHHTLDEAGIVVVSRSLASHTTKLTWPSAASWMTTHKATVRTCTKRHSRTHPARCTTRSHSVTRIAAALVPIVVAHSAAHANVTVMVLLAQGKTVIVIGKTDAHGAWHGVVHLPVPHALRPHSTQQALISLTIERGGLASGYAEPLSLRS